MPIDLTKPIAWKQATHEEQKMLRALQGNILKSHGRASTINIFFKINPLQKHAMRAALREMANFHATSAYQQLLDTEAFKVTGLSGPPFVAVFLSATGYSALGVVPAQIPADPSFKTGMKTAGLADPLPPTWEAGFQGQIDGMILVASDDETALDRKQFAIVTLLNAAGGLVVKQQAGKQLFNPDKRGIEHFGYVDGRSQPLVLLEDVQRESEEAGISQWDPQSTLGVALIPEPGSTDGVSFGSYFVFRKLEQDVRGFKRQEQILATVLTLTGEARELAGALAVGRFEDGTPVTLSDEAKNVQPANDFNYGTDPGARCPFHGHIRKTNPRGSGGFEPPAVEKNHLMIRRGITFEDVPRQVHPSDVPSSSSVADFDAHAGPMLPIGGVGLLFMTYNHDLGLQFEFTQKSWANTPGFPAAPTPPGIDPVMGQGVPPSIHNWPKAWDDPTKGTAPLAFQGFVHMRGGEYFFAPSLNFLKAL